MSDEEVAADKQIRHAVHEALAVQGYGDEGMITVDVLVIVSQRGFEGDDGTSRVLLMQPTDTPPFVALGMLAEGRLFVEECIRRTYRIEEND